MGNFIHVFIIPRPGITRQHIEATLNGADDWFRYHDNVYVLFSDVGVAEWSNRLMGLAKPEGELFISRLDPFPNQGWMTTEFWKWIIKDRSAANIDTVSLHTLAEINAGRAPLGTGMIGSLSDIGNRPTVNKLAELLAKHKDKN